MVPSVFQRWQLSILRQDSAGRFMNMCFRQTAQGSENVKNVVHASDAYIAHVHDII